MSPTELETKTKNIAEQKRLLREQQAALKKQLKELSVKEEESYSPQQKKVKEVRSMTSVLRRTTAAGDWAAAKTQAHALAKYIDEAVKENAQGGEQKQEQHAKH